MVSGAIVLLLNGTLRAETVPAAQRGDECRDWKMIVGSVEGPEGCAAQLVNEELGKFIIRDAGIYAIHTLPVVCANDRRMVPGRNQVLIGTLADNASLAEIVKPSDIPPNGYCVKVFEKDDARTIAIAGSDPESVLYGAVDFTEDGLAALTPEIGNGIRIANYTLDTPPGHQKRHMRPFAYESRRAPKTAIRSVFTWGHVISDYHEYFRNLARLKLNEVILWNDYEPLNAKEIVACAHSWGVKVIWGFAWGWSTGCDAAKIDDASLKKLENDIVASWRETWGRLPGDGIYFQSFTETNSSEQDGRSIAEAVVKLVNATAARIWAEKPETRIIFGLHATSVRNRFAEITKTDPRMDIYWEDVGGFPFDARTCNALAPEDEKAFLGEILSEKRRVGIVYKCQLFQDWHNFHHQKGPYLLGVSGKDVMAHDLSVTAEAWRGYTSQWLKGGAKAHADTRAFQSRNPASVLCLAGNFNGPLHFAAALASELFWSADESYDEVLGRVLRRQNITR